VTRPNPGQHSGIHLSKKERHEPPGAGDICCQTPVQVAYDLCKASRLGRSDPQDRTGETGDVEPHVAVRPEIDDGAARARRTRDQQATRPTPRSRRRSLPE
jgi:hypothetical protein